MFGADYHPGAPGHRFIQGDRFQDTQSAVPVQLLLDLLLPVDGYGDGCVGGHRSLVWVNMESERRQTSDEGELLVTALVEG